MEDLAFAHPAAEFPPEWRRLTAEVPWDSVALVRPYNANRLGGGRALASGKTTLNFNNLVGYRWFDLFQEVAYDRLVHPDLLREKLP